MQRVQLLRPVPAVSTRLPSGNVHDKSFSTRKPGHGHGQVLAAAVAERQRQLRNVTSASIHNPLTQRIHQDSKAPVAAAMRM